MLLTSPIRGDAVGGAAVSAVRDLRAHLIPGIFRGSGAKVYVGGITAENVDYFDAVTNPTPYVLLFVLGLSFVLLTVAFRSVVVALVSVLLNLLSVGAAYGLLTLVFLDDHGASLFGFQHTHVIDAWVPLFLFSVLFGLSMDYQVFLMSRIKERYDASGSTHDAVVGGVATTARIITGAALIIVVVFAGFAAGKARDVPADGLRHRRRAPARRDDHPLGRPAGCARPARPAQLVPAALARVAPARRGRAAGLGAARGGPLRPRGT